MRSNKKYFTIFHKTNCKKPNHAGTILLSLKRLPLRLFYYLVNAFFYSGDKVSRQLYPYFPTYRAASGEVLNQLYRVLRKISTYTVQGILIEPTNHCNLRCRHCSIQNRKDIKKGYMDFNLYKSVIDNNQQLTCIILTRNGEPLLHPQIFDMIEYARQKNIYISIYTNGLLLNDENIERIFKSGLCEINFSMEGTGDYYTYNRGKEYEKLVHVIKKVLEERKLRKSPLSVGINVAMTTDSTHVKNVYKEWDGVVDYIMVEPLMAEKGNPRSTSCKTLWRNLVIAWDGEVVPCCVDMHNSMVLGNINRNTLLEILNGSRAKEFRACHINKKYPPVCKYCDTHFG